MVPNLVPDSYDKGPMFRSITVAALLLLATTPLAAQSDSSLKQGEPIRVVYRCKLVRGQVAACDRRREPRLAAGAFQAMDRDTLRLIATSGEAPLAIPRTAIADVLVVDGKRGNVGMGVGIGLLVGAGLGGLIASQAEFCILDCSPATPFGVIIGAPIGALLGGVIGSQIRSDRWSPIEMSSISLRPRRGGVSVGLAFAF